MQNFITMLNTTAQQPDSVSGMLITFLPLIALVVFFYFFMYKPQKKQEKEIKDMRDSLTIGDEIVTSGGIMGRISKVHDDYVVIETGADRNKLKMKKSAVINIEKKSGESSSKPSTFKVSSGSKKNDEKAPGNTEESK